MGKIYALVTVALIALSIFYDIRTKNENNAFDSKYHIKSSWVTMSDGKKYKKTEIDGNEDGKPDVTEYYSEQTDSKGNNLLVKEEYDKNYDGFIDVVATFTTDGFYPYKIETLNGYTVPNSTVSGEFVVDGSFFHPKYDQGQSYLKDNAYYFSNGRLNKLEESDSDTGKLLYIILFDENGNETSTQYFN